MRILFVGNLNPHFANTNTYRLKALQGLGHEPIFFEDRDFALPGRIRERFAFLQGWDLGRLNRRMVEVAQKKKPHLCLAVGGYRISRDTLVHLRRMGVKTALWTTDAPRQEFQHVVATAPLYDRIFCAGTEAMEILAKAGRPDAVWLPFACDPDFHRPVELTQEERRRYGRDLIFVGAYYPNRWEILRGLIGRYDIGIWGPGWQQASDEKSRNVLHAEPLNHSQWVRMYNAAKMVLVVHYQEGAIPCFQASPKVFEALACRSFVLVDAQRDVFKLFVSGRHLIGFNGIEDLKAKIDYYLNRDEERREIAAAGCREAMQRHTYRDRLKAILDDVGGAV